MKKLNNLSELKKKIKLICWDLDGTLFDTETMWFNMDKIVIEKYGKDLSKQEANKASEEIAANAYKTWGYRANAEIALNHFKDKKIFQIVINRCELTNQTMYINDIVNKTFSFHNFDGIVSEKSFTGNFTNEEMYLKAIDMVKITDKSEVVAICDMPFELRAAKNSGITTIWAKNNDYPFTEAELNEINEVANYYVEDFYDLIK